jgi:hypothetical protein
MRSLAFGMILLKLLAGVTVSASRTQSDKPGVNERVEVRQTSPSQERDPNPGGSIRGRVVGEGNRPIADASIIAFPVNIASNPQAMVTSLFRPVSSDADGKFELGGLQPGAYNISATTPGYVLSDSDAKPFYRPGDAVTLRLVKGGVITGKVTNSSGDPVVGAIVRAIKVREIDNKPVHLRRDISSEFGGSINSMLGPYKTDDRGIYRIYGLAAGHYQVAAGGGGERGGFPLGDAGAYDSDAPTYFPSSTLDTAAEVTLRAGDEITSIDIRYRDNRGHSISGSVLDSKGLSRQGISVVLTRANSGIVEATTFVIPSAKEKGFAFNAVLDGEYFVTATAEPNEIFDATEGMKISASQSRHVAVSGADVTGIELALEPLGSIAGRAVIEAPQDAAKKPECKPDRRARVEEFVISAQAEGKRQSEVQTAGLLSVFKDTTPNQNGEFTVGFLRPGVHHLDLQLPAEHLYIKSITLPTTIPNGKPLDAARNGVHLKSGDNVKGLVATLSEGAAGLRGKVVAGEENKPPPAKMRVHLVPAEPEAVDEVLRYFEAEVASDASFSLINLAPGKYWLVAREMSEQEQLEADRKPLAWNSAGRMGLRFEGDASKKVIDLSYCQRVADLVLKYTPLIKPSKRPAKKPAP